MSSLCPKCGLACEEAEFKVHIINHCQPTVKCPLCSQYYSNPAALLRHTRAIHHKEFQCTICQKDCASKYDLKRHLAMTHKQIAEGKAAIKTYQCPECDKTFVGKFFLDRHVQGAHNKEFDCKLCGRIFASDYSLKRHLVYKHTNEQIDLKETTPILQSECPKCGEQFVGSWSLKRHIRIKHNKDITCHLCEKDCSSEKALKSHIASRHATEEKEEDLFKKKWICQQCPQRFTAKWSLKLHVEGKHEQKFKCNICNEVLAAPFPLMRHKKLKHGIEEPKKIKNESHKSKSKKKSKSAATDQKQKSIESKPEKDHATSSTSNEIKVEESLDQTPTDEEFFNIEIKEEFL